MCWPGFCGIGAILSDGGYCQRTIPCVTLARACGVRVRDMAGTIGGTPDRHNRHHRGIITVMSNEYKGKQLRRSREDRVVAGVCAGLADYFGIDVYIVRLVFAGLAILGGTGILLYLVAWLILPEEGESASIAEGFINKNKS